MRTLLLVLLLLAPALAQAPGLYRPFEDENPFPRIRFDRQLPQLTFAKKSLEVPVNRRLEPLRRGGASALLLEPDPNQGGARRDYCVLFYKPGPVSGMAYFRFGLLTPDLDESIRLARRAQRTWRPDGPSEAFITQDVYDRWAALPAVPSAPAELRALLLDYYRYLIAHPALDEGSVLGYMLQRGFNPYTLKPTGEQAGLRGDPEILRLRNEWQRLPRR